MTARRTAQERLIRGYQRLLQAEVNSARQLAELAGDLGRAATRPLTKEPDRDPVVARGDAGPRLRPGAS